MKKSQEESLQVKAAKIELGKLIKALHDPTDGTILSMRKVANAVGLPPSNLKYIEDGVNAPSPEIYQALVDFLKPEKSHLKEMDKQYSIIRGTPPPDVCKILCANEGLNDALRIINSQQLSTNQLNEITALLNSFKTHSTEGDSNNG